MTWTIEFDVGVEKDLKKLGHNAQQKIFKYIKTKLLTAEDPRSFGKLLTGDHKGLWRYRVGDYRLVTQIEDSRLIILIIHIGHRKNVYD